MSCMTKLVLTLLGDDRPGLVSAVSRAVADHGDVPSDSVHGYYRQSQAVLDRLDRILAALEARGARRAGLPRA